MHRHLSALISVVVIAIALSAVLAGCQQFSFGQTAPEPTPTAVPATATHVPTAVPSTATRAPTAVPTALPATATLAPVTATPTAFVPAPAPQANAPAAQAQPTPVPAVLTDVDQIAQAASDGVHGTPFELTISQDEITQQMTTYLENNPDMAFSNIGVTLTPGAGLVTGNAKIAGFSVPFKATVTVEVVDGKPRLKVLQLDVLGGLIPGFIKNQLIAMIEQNADLPIVQDLPVTLTEVEIQDGQAVARGTLN